MTRLLNHETTVGKIRICPICGKKGDSKNAYAVHVSCSILLFLRTLLTIAGSLILMFVCGLLWYRGLLTAAEYLAPSVSTMQTGLFFFIGGLAAIIWGGVVFLMSAYEEYPVWAVGCVVMPPLIFIFAIKHWRIARSGFLIGFAGVTSAVFGMILFGM